MKLTSLMTFNIAPFVLCLLFIYGCIYSFRTLMEGLQSSYRLAIMLISFCISILFWLYTALSCAPFIPFTLLPNLFQKLSNLRINSCLYQHCKRMEEGKRKPREKQTSREKERRFQVAARVILKVEKKWLL